MSPLTKIKLIRNNSMIQQVKVALLNSPGNCWESSFLSRVSRLGDQGGRSTGGEDLAMEAEKLGLRNCTMRWRGSPWSRDELELVQS